MKKTCYVAWFDWGVSEFFHLRTGAPYTHLGDTGLLLSHQVWLLRWLTASLNLAERRTSVTSVIVELRTAPYKV
jgi:hypothetical protein